MNCTCNHLSSLPPPRSLFSSAFLGMGMKDFDVNPDQITLRVRIKVMLRWGNAIMCMGDVLSGILFNSNNCAASAAWVEVCALVSSFPVPFVLIVDKTQIIHNTTTHSRYNNIHIILPDHPKKIPDLSQHPGLPHIPRSGRHLQLAYFSCSTQGAGSL